MNVYTDIKMDGWYRVVKCDNEALDMVAYIAVHNVQLGHSLGGCRFWEYDSDENALMDALRLSRAMTYKNCLADLPHGGGKSVISAVSGQKLTPDMLKAMGEFVNYVNKNGPLYEIAEDVGVSSTALDYVREVSPMVAAKVAGDPSPITAEGVFMGLTESWKYISGSDNFEDVRVAVQGVGAVGYCLVERLVDYGFQVTVCDVREENVQKAQQRLGVGSVSPEHIYNVPMDIFAPCALYGTVNPATIDIMSAKLIAGCANNQLSSPNVDDLLVNKGVVYAPDYVINAGGVIQVSGIEDNGYDHSIVEKHLEIIPRNLTKIYKISNSTGIATGKVANRLVEEKLGLE